MSWDLRRLFQNHAPGIQRALRLRGAAPDIAEDLVQDAFLRVIGRPPGPAAAAGNPRGYLFRVAYNLLIDLRRREQRLPLVVLDLETVGRIADPTPSSEVRLRDRERLERAAQALEELPERTRRAFELNRLEGLTIAEVGARLGISTTRAWGLIHDAYRHLRDRLRDDAP